MREPERLNRSKGLGSTLLASAKGDRVPDGATRRVLGSATVAAALATSASSSAAAVASALPTIARIAGWKWIAVGIAGAGAVTGALSVAPSTRGPADVPAATVPHAATPATQAAPVRVQPDPSATLPPDPLPVATASARPATVPSPTAAPAPHATAAPMTPTAAPPPSHLADEIAAIDDAKRTLAGSAPATALQKLDAYDAAFPHGTLGAEASALRIEALARAGRKEEARDALRRFRESHPASPLLESLARAVGE